MSDPNVLMQDDDIDVIGLFSALKRKWWLVLLITILTAVCLFLFLSVIPSRYESNARIIIESKDNAFNRPVSDNGGQQLTNQYDEEAIRSQVEILNSDKIALRILDLLEQQDQSKNTDHIEQFEKSSFLDKIGDFFAPDNKRKFEPGNEGAISGSQSAILREFKEQLNIYPIEKSRAIVIEFWANSPQTAFEVPNLFAEEYVNTLEQKKKNLTADAKVWLNPIVTEYSNNLKKAEAEVAAFRARENVLRGSSANESLARQQLSEISTELSRLRAERSSAQAKVASIRAALKSGASLDVIPEVIASPLIQRLREREVEIRAQISDLSTTLLPNHPRLKALNSQVNDFARQIRTAANNILKSLENNVNLTKETEEDLLKEIAELKQEVVRVSKQEVKLDSLIRKADSYRELLSEYQKRNLDAISRADFAPIDAEIYPSRTMPSKPYFPKIIPFTIAGTVAAFVLSILGVMAVTLISSIGNARNTNSQDYKDEEDLSQLDITDEDEILVSDGDDKNEKAKPIRNNPFAQLENIIKGNSDKRDAKHAIIAPDADKKIGLGETLTKSSPKDDVSDANKPNAIAVRYAASVFQDLGEGRIVVTSPGGDRGSKTAWILARQLSETGDNGVVVIDLSGGGASATEMLGGNDLPGIFNLISGSVAVNSIIYRDQNSSAHVVPSGTMFHGDPAPDMQTMSDVIDAIAMSYDYCIVDCGDANLDGIDLVSTDDAVVIISGVNARIDDCKNLEADLREDGFKDILHIIPDATDHKNTQTPENA